MSVAMADITGKPRIIDGDTVEIAGERSRHRTGPARVINGDIIAIGKERIANASNSSLTEKGEKR